MYPISCCNISWSIELECSAFSIVHQHVHVANRKEKENHTKGVVWEKFTKNFQIDKSSTVPVRYRITGRTWNHQMIGTCAKRTTHAQEVWGVPFSPLAGPKEWHIPHATIGTGQDPPKTHTRNSMYRENEATQAIDEHSSFGYNSSSFRTKPATFQWTARIGICSTLCAP